MTTVLQNVGVQPVLSSAAARREASSTGTHGSLTSTRMSNKIDSVSTIVFGTAILCRSRDIEIL